MQAPDQIERDAWIDLLRVASVAVVVIGHWVTTTVIWEDDRIGIENALSVVRGSHISTWLIQVMPVMFFVGGFSNYRSYDRHDRAYLGFLRSRLARLLAPTLVFVGIWTVIGFVAQVSDLGLPNIVDRAADLAALPFWFLGLYLFVVALAPMMLQLHRRFGSRAAGAMAGGAALVDLVHHGLGVPHIGYLNFALVWLLAHQIGFLYADGSLVRLSQRAVLAATAAGLAMLVLLTTVGGYPVSLVGVPGDERWNTNPPSLALVALTCWLIGLALLAREPLQRSARRWQPWIARGECERPDGVPVARFGAGYRRCRGLSAGDAETGYRDRRVVDSASGVDSRRGRGAAVAGGAFPTIRGAPEAASCDVCAAIICRNCCGRCRADRLCDPGFRSHGIQSTHRSTWRGPPRTRIDSRAQSPSPRRRHPPSRCAVLVADAEKASCALDCLCLPPRLGMARSRRRRATRDELGYCPGPRCDWGGRPRCAPIVPAGGATMNDPPAAADCELIGDGFLGQPVNAISSLTFVLVGLLLMRRRPVLGWAGIAVGFGSFLFHGPMPGWGKWAHDVSLALVAVAIAFEARPRVVAVITGAVAAVFAIWPGVAEAVTAILAIEAAAIVFARRSQIRTGPGVAAALMLVAGAVIAALSRSGGPLCDPDTIVQGHGVWHLLAAGALWLWTLASERAPAESRPRS
jgi:fucose 4-O-acetylase-like acetyltransferase